ncbi:MAG: hypothetical protein CYG60_14780 [Actinobacteria bacterium]|nr:MAG: hypothetical protein CYG60_14780 [Actinomycetota bacterium]
MWKVVAVSDFFENLFNHIHGAVTHFPIALPFVSVGVDYFAAKRPGLQGGAWLLLVLGSLGTVAATITGLVAHLAYEDDSVLLSAIDRHQYLGFATTALFVGLTAWSSMRRGDVGGSRAYLVVALVGLAVLALTGFLGGNLLTEWGIGVKGITR